MEEELDRRRLSTLANSLTIQRRVIGALVLREILTRYGRHNIGFLWLFVEPMMFTLGISALWTLTGLHQESDIPIIAFAVTGYSTVLLWRNMPARCIGAIEPNLALVYHRNVRALDIFLARLLLEIMGATVSFVVLSTIFISLDLMQPPEDALQVLQGWALTAWFGGSLAITLGALGHQSEMVDKFWHPLSYIVMPLSGIAFVVDALPPALREFVLWIPMAHGTEIIRDGYFGSHFTAHFDVGYMVLVCSIMSLLGLSQTRYISSRVTPE
jgi:ABC-2 type transport system permease protein/capsular polysaccharide transport system permease protein